MLHDYGEELPVNSLAVSPDGRWLAGPNYPRGTRHPGEEERVTITLLDVAANRSRRGFSDNRIVDARGVAFSPDGGTLTAVGDCRIPGDRTTSGFLALWDVQSGREMLFRHYPDDHPLSVVFSPDGRLVATGSIDRRVRLRETATGQERRCLAGHENQITHLAFSRDGKLLATASPDAPVFVWDVEGRYGRPPSTEPFSDEERASLWEGLAHGDGTAAFAAMRQLLARPGPAVALLRERVPLRTPDEAAVRQLLLDLDADAFPVRERATARLKAAAERLDSRLRDALARHPSVEARRRLESILSAVDPNSPEHQRDRRLLEVLERLATPDARELLQTLADSSQSAVLASEARVAVGRLRRP
jgi:hypothetical protein